MRQLAVFPLHPENGIIQPLLLVVVVSGMYLLVT
jgi:hypothetical protein